MRIVRSAADRDLLRLLCVLLSIAAPVFALCLILQREPGGGARGATFRCAAASRHPMEPPLWVLLGRHLELATLSQHRRCPLPPAVTDRATAKLARRRSSSTACA